MPPESLVHAQTRGSSDAGSASPRLESILVEAVAANLRAHLGRSDVAVFREVTAGRSIADVVAVIPGRRLAALRPLSVWESFVLAAVRQLGSTRIDVLERVCGFEPRALREDERRFDRLVKIGFLKRGGGGSVQVGSTWGRSFYMVAIEAKLTRWRDALEQAREYRQFADQAFVALPETSIPLARRHRADFETAGVGLLSVNGQIKTIISAKAATDHDWRREFLWSRLVPASDNAH
jgi:hypothetical protein